MSLHDWQRFGDTNVGLGMVRDDPQEKEYERLRALYHELLYAVARKYPGETRHQTALRYIRQAEEGPACPPGQSPDAATPHDR